MFDYIISEESFINIMCAIIFISCIGFFYISSGMKNSECIDRVLAVTLTAVWLVMFVSIFINGIVKGF